MLTGRRCGGTGSKIDAVQQDTAGAGLLEARDQPQQRRLAAAGRSEQREELALIDVERKMIDRGEAAEALADAFDPQQRLQSAIGPRARESRVSIRRSASMLR